MTIKELQIATAGLGFEDTLDSSSRFISSANRAIYSANRIRPKDAWIEIEHSFVEGVECDTVINGIGYTLYKIENDDFLCLCPSPVMSDGKFLTEGKDYLREGASGLLFKTNENAKYRIHYYKKVRLISEDDEGEEIDLDEDICLILPLLVASYVWLDDEEEKAELYRKLFYSEAAQITNFSGNTSSHSAPYFLDGGWDG